MNIRISNPAGASEPTWTVTIFGTQYDGLNTSKNHAGVSHRVVVAQILTSKLQRDLLRLGRLWVEGEK